MVKSQNCKTKSGEMQGKKSGVVFYDFMAKERTDLNLAPVSSSSGSSGITEVTSNNDSDDHEESSSCSSFSASVRRKTWL